MSQEDKRAWGSMTPEGKKIVGQFFMRKAKDSSNNTSAPTRGGINRPFAGQQSRKVNTHELQATFEDPPSIAEATPSPATVETKPVDGQREVKTHDRQPRMDLVAKVQATRANMADILSPKASKTSSRVVTVHERMAPTRYDDEPLSNDDSMLGQQEVHMHRHTPRFDQKAFLAQRQEEEDNAQQQRPSNEEDNAQQQRPST